MVDIVCYWASDCRSWICYAVDADGYQLWEADYFPNRARMAEAFNVTL